MPSPRRRASRASQQKRYRLGRRRPREQQGGERGDEDRLRGLDVGIRRASRRIFAAAEQVGLARRFVRNTLGPAHPQLDDAQLLTSELVAAAISHTDSDTAEVPLVLRVQCTATWARVELADRSTARFPAVLQAATHHPEEGGIALVERVAGRWGAMRECEGAELWFEMGEPKAE